MEAEIKSPESESKKCHAMNVAPKKSELSEVKDLLIKLNERTGRLEKEKHEHNSSAYAGRDFSRSQRRGFSRPPGRGQGSQRGRSNEPLTPTRQLQFLASCFNCGRKGHIARLCPN
ncbi:hypothetical protein DPMN_014515 [Dreissena polymorpha]|uniref:CCHC-type domain-containing protein n=1 Tax=Dreissena polymorpha TaxID=45954 RepID=A0A9D4NB29_DREPO|nr:hypothetical protein DPMN_014515 [Dreissena polymorpha]